jgi:adenylate cyclase
MEEDPGQKLATDENWRAFLMGEEPIFHRYFRVFRVLPSSPRCKVCYAPYKGAGGVVMRMMGRRPARMNPKICSVCEDYAQKHPGGAEIPLSVLFADIRGSTALAEKLGTMRFSALISRFYRAVTDELIRENAMIDRLIGDEVIALFVPVLAGSDHAKAAVMAAQGILKATGHGTSEGPWVPVGVGVHTGTAFVGAVGAAGVSDITALGDDVNLTARLAAQASTGEILLTEAARSASGLETAGLEARSFTMKGRSSPVDGWLLRVGAGPKNG